MDVKKLIEIVKNDDKKISYKDYEKKSDVNNFLLTFNIENGTVRYDKDLLYLWYLTWSKKPLTDRQFQKQLKKKLKPGTRGYWYDINEEVLTISKEEILKRVVNHVFKKRIGSEREEAKKEKKGSPKS